MMKINNIPTAILGKVVALKEAVSWCSDALTVVGMVLTLILYASAYLNLSPSTQLIEAMQYTATTRY